MRLRAGVTRGLLLYVMVLLPALVAAQPPPPPPPSNLSCTELFGSAPEFVLCGEAATTCSFNARTAGGTCNQMCSRLGSTCVGAINNGASCEESPGNTDTCETSCGPQFIIVSPRRVRVSSASSTGLLGQGHAGHLPSKSRQ